MEAEINLTPERIKEVFKVLESKGMIYFSESGFYVPEGSGWKLLFGRGPVKEEIKAFTSEKLKLKDEKCLKITKEEKIDDSTFAIKADKGAKDLSTEFKNELRKGKMVNVIIEVDGIKDTIIAFGSADLKLKDDKSISIRRDDKIDDSTVAILSNRGVKDLKEELKKKLKEKDKQVKIILEIY
jgi:hypothetical protein